MPTHASTREKVLAWTLVCAQLALIGAVVLWPGRRTWPVPGWLLAVSVALVLLDGLVAVVAAAALGPGLTASPLPNVRARLRTSGPYAWVRHPIYTGLLVATAGAALASGRPARLIAWLLLVLLLWAKGPVGGAPPAYALPGLRRVRGANRSPIAAPADPPDSATTPRAVGQ